ncbi:efflux RND transporter periplasmic adaptor subunit [Rhodoferax sp. PAMC 29310]|uniref:efflux RND transporter periplasmic adaptor subunit n=1 Tax=Rhodoferax sp. PAMC 29310 TaxID=2822760 RepID=UPI001B327CA4|nr:efflux RND transporter periplasmic adaptor subunit [Rhodoferax sp. PAMC 29310]
MNRRTLLLLVLAASSGAAAFAWYTMRAPAVAAMVVHSQPLVRTLLFSARVASTSRVEIGATLTGRVAQVNVAEGARVKRGDILVQLESDELQAALAQAQAGVRQAQAKLAALQSSGRSAVQANLEQAESVLLAAKKDLARTQELVARNFVSAARLDESQRAAAVATAQRDAALGQLQANARQGADWVGAQAQVAQAQATLASAQARLEQATLTAPADARVLLRGVEPGQIVQPGRALLTLALDSPVQLVGQVDERYMAQVQLGQKAVMRADAFAQQPFDAKVQFIAPVVDAQRGAVEVKLILSGPVPDFLREDMTLSVELVTGQRDQALVVPAQALGAQAGGTTASVRLAQEGRVVARSVRLGLRTLDAVEVLDGLAAGDVILLSPTPAVGQRVKADTRAGFATPKRAGDDAGAAMSNAMGR